MARSLRYEPLNVFLNGRLVGQLRRERSGAISFNYDASWILWPSAIPVSLSLPVREEAYSGPPVFAVFDNLLPDNQVLRQKIAARARAEGTDAYSLLRAIGHDCVGALQFLPIGADSGPSGAIEADPIDEHTIAEILQNLTAAPLGITEDPSFRISIAGAQEKTALLFWKKRWYKPRGTTPTTHILKPSIGKLQNGIDLTHSVENEYLCLKLLQDLGFPVAKAEMTMFGDRRVLVVERFDRHWTAEHRLIRLPQEDCCQALSFPPTLKYEIDGGPQIANILRLLEGSDDPAGDRRLFLKAMISFWLLGATDGHAKNFSVFLFPQGRFHLTPLYDVISAQPSVDAKQIKFSQFALAMSVGMKRRYKIMQIAMRHFDQTAEQAGMGSDVVESIREELCAVVETAVESVLNTLPAGFPDSVAASIVGGIRRRLIRLQTPKVEAVAE